MVVGTYHGCQVRGFDALCLYGDYRVYGDYRSSMDHFYVLWSFAVAWMLFMAKLWPRIRLSTYAPCGWAEATHALVTIPKDAAVPAHTTNGVTLLCRRVSRCLEVFVQRWAGTAESQMALLPVEVSAAGRFVVHEGKRFALPSEGKPLHEVNAVLGEACGDFHARRGGISDERASAALAIVGPNVIPYTPQTHLQCLVAECSRVTFVYQAAMYMIWIFDGYVFVGGILLSVVLGTLAKTIMSKVQSQRSLAASLGCASSVEALRGNEWKTISQASLVPGDVVRVVDGTVASCDIVVIDGQAICDESQLTGESLPVQKDAVPNAAVEFRGSVAKRGTLFAGTVVLQAGGPDAGALGIVRATGMSTSRGDAIRATLFPRKVAYRYDEELAIVYKFLGVYALFCFAIGYYFQTQTGSRSFFTVRLSTSMYTVSQVMTPLLSLSFVLAQMPAVRRLVAAQITCVDPARIAIAGKVNVACFDKTGTLTQQGLTFLRVDSCGHSEAAFSGLGKREDLIQAALAITHSLTRMGQQIIGSVLEQEMFRASGWTMDRGSGPGKGTMVVRAPDGAPGTSGTPLVLERLARFDFEHARALMSVVVSDATGRTLGFVKGSPEAVAELCSVPTVPPYMLEHAKRFASEGCYVLALGARALAPATARRADVQRSEVEQRCTFSFLGLLLFRNEAKPDSANGIQALRHGRVRPVMITGDNAHCARYIAGAVGMFNARRREHLLAVLHDAVHPEAPAAGIEWVPMHDEAGDRLSTSDVLQSLGQHELIVTEQAMRLLGDDVMERLLLHVRVFARMSPTGKTRVLEQLNERGLVTMMCGDGGNDTGALRAAHVGVAFSDADASAVSPFTSRAKSVPNVVSLVCEGRATLGTSIALFKFLLMYGQMFVISKLIGNYYGYFMCLMLYLMFDVVAVLSLGYAMTRSRPLNHLRATRPSTSLLGPSTAASVLGTLVVNVSCLAACLSTVTNHPDYVRWPARLSSLGSWFTLWDTWEATAVGIPALMLMAWSAVVFSLGGQFRRPVWSNSAVLAVFAGLDGLISLALLMDSNAFTRLFHVASEAINGPGTDHPVWSEYQKEGNPPSPGMDSALRWQLWALVHLAMTCSLAWEHFVNIVRARRVGRASASAGRHWRLERELPLTAIDTHGKVDDLKVPLLV